MKKKTFFSLFLAALLTVLSAMPARALAPGVSPTMWEVIKLRADLMRARDLAYARQMVKKPSSLLATTCYDQQLKLTSYLGSIFSDVIPPNVLPPSPVFTVPIAFPDRGRMSPLPGTLGTVVDPMLSSVLTNFQGSLSGLLGGGTSGFGSWAANWLQGWLGNLGWNGQIPAVDCRRIADMWDNVVATHGQSIEGTGVDLLAGYITMDRLIRGDMQGMGEDFIRQIVNDRALFIAALNMESNFGPGKTDAWPAPLMFSRKARVVDVINAM